MSAGSRCDSVTGPPSHASPYLQTEQEISSHELNFMLCESCRQDDRSPLTLFRSATWRNIKLDVVCQDLTWLRVRVRPLSIVVGNNRKYCSFVFILCCRKTYFRLLSCLDLQPVFSTWALWTLKVRSSPQTIENRLFFKPEEIKNKSVDCEVYIKKSKKSQDTGSIPVPV